LINQNAAETGMVTESGYKKLQAAEQRLANILGPEINSVAGKAAMLDSKMKLAAYRFAMMEGQSGRDLSDKDISRWQEILSSTNDPKVLHEKLSSLVSNKINSLRAEGQQVIQDNQQVIEFERDFGFNPWGSIQTVEERLANEDDPLIQSGLEYINSKPQDEAVGANDWSGMPEWAPQTGMSPAGFRKLSAKGKELLEKKYGGTQNASNPE
jgi:hypothetical protein